MSSLSERSVKATYIPQVSVPSQHNTKERRLDNTALIIPAVASEKDPYVYRISVVLADTVQPQLLQEALTETMPNFKSFSVRLKNKFFRRTLESCTYDFQIMEETGELCDFIDFKDTSKPLFRVLYAGNEIHLEVFHVLTDGSGALRFLIALTQRYCQKAYPEQFEGESIDHYYGPDYIDAAPDNYTQIIDPKHQTFFEKDMQLKPIFRLKVDKDAKVPQYVRRLVFSVEQLKKLSKAHGVTLGVYCTALIAYSFNQIYQIPRGENLGIAVPVNLRKMFGTDTLSNFFSNIIIVASGSELSSFEESLRTINEEFAEKSTREQIVKTVSYSVGMENYWLFRAMPRPLKDIVLKLIYLTYKKRRTLTFSNMGFTETHPKFAHLVKDIQAIAACSYREPLRILACSYGDEFTLSFTAELNTDNLIDVILKTIEEDRLGCATSDL